MTCKHVAEDGHSLAIPVDCDLRIAFDGANGDGTQQGAI